MRIRKPNYEMPSIAVRNICSGSSLLASSLVIPMSMAKTDVYVEPFEKVQSAEGTDHFDITFE